MELYESMMISLFKEKENHHMILMDFTLPTVNSMEWNMAPISLV